MDMCFSTITTISLFKELYVLKKLVSMLFILFHISAKGQGVSQCHKGNKTVIVKFYYKFRGQDRNTFDVKNSFNSKLKVI